MAAYVLAEIEITNPEGYKAYTALVPATLRQPGSEKQMQECIGQSYSQLKELFDAFCDVSEDITPAAATFVLAHRKDFAEYLNQLETS